MSDEKVNKGGRPKAIDVTDKQVLKDIEMFGKLGATHEEMSWHFDVEHRTIQNYMADEEGAFFRTYKKAYETFTRSLRRTQVKKAVDDEDTSMLIWLGKTVLKQKEPKEPIDLNAKSININLGRKKKDD